MVRSIERETFILVINELIFVTNKYFRLYRHRAVPRVLWRVVLISKLRQSASTGELRFYWHRAVRECLGSCGGSLVQLLNCGVLYSYPRCVSLSIQLGYHSYPGGNYRSSSMYIKKKGVDPLRAMYRRLSLPTFISENIYRTIYKIWFFFLLFPVDFATDGWSWIFPFYVHIVYHISDYIVNNISSPTGPPMVLLRL